MRAIQYPEITKLVLLCLALIQYQAPAQNVEFGSGLTFPELINFSSRYIGSKFQVGVAYGFAPVSDPINTYTIDVGSSFGKDAKNAPFKKSQARMLVTYYREETDKRIFKNTYMTFRIGRNYFFSPRFGINLEGGILIEVYEKIISKDGTPVNNFLEEIDDVLPSAAIRFFYRI